MDVALFAYRRGSSVMHRMPPLVKLALLLILCAVVFVGSDSLNINAALVVRLFLCAALCAVAFIAAKTPLRSLCRLSFVLVLGVLVTVFRTVLFLPLDGASFDVGMGTENAENARHLVRVFTLFALDLDGFWGGIVYTIQFLITTLAANVLFETTSSLEIRGALESVQNVLAVVFPPLKKWNPALVVSLAINFIPQVFETWNRVHTASLARAGANKKKFRLRIVLAEFSALFSCLLHQAETKRLSLLNRSGST